MSKDTKFDPADPDTWPDRMTTGEVARIFRVAPTTAYMWASTGRAPAYRTPGGHFRFHRTDIAAMVRGLPVDATDVGSR